MQLSVSAWCLQKKLYNKEMDILDFIKYCKNNNVNNVELLDCFLGEDINKIIELLNSLEMKVSSYSIGNDFVHTSESQREIEIDSVITGIDTAVLLNTKLLRIFSGNVKDDIPFDLGKTWIIESFQRVIKYAEQKDITLVLENHGFFAGKSSQVKEIIQLINSPNLKSNADVGNFLLVEENPLTAVKSLNNDISYVHFKDFKYVGDNPSIYSSISGKHYEGTILGKGDVPLPEIVNYLNELGYKGYLSIEYEGIEDPLIGTTESIKYAQSIIK